MRFFKLASLALAVGLVATACTTRGSPLNGETGAAPTPAATVPLTNAMSSTALAVCADYTSSYDPELLRLGLNWVADAIDIYLVDPGQQLDVLVQAVIGVPPGSHGHDAERLRRRHDGVQLSQRPLLPLSPTPVSVRNFVKPGAEQTASAANALAEETFVAEGKLGELWDDEWLTALADARDRLRAEVTDPIRRLRTWVDDRGSDWAGCYHAASTFISRSSADVTIFVTIGDLVNFDAQPPGAQDFAGVQVVVLGLACDDGAAHCVAREEGARAYFTGYGAVNVRLADVGDTPVLIP